MSRPSSLRWGVLIGAAMWTAGLFVFVGLGATWFVFHYPRGPIILHGPFTHVAPSLAVASIQVAPWHLAVPARIDLKTQFGGLNEAIAASYNGGEDNAARWLSHTNPKDPGIFASEVGFAETKNYVFKVMTYYRVYRDLYDESLARK